MPSEKCQGVKASCAPLPVFREPLLQGQVGLLAIWTGFRNGHKAVVLDFPSEGVMLERNHQRRDF